MAGDKLLLGSGTWHWEGWTGLDADPAHDPNIVAVVPPLPDVVLSQQWSAILASHFIEHLYKWQALDLLKQCYQILEPGGVLTLEQPNLDYCMRVALGLLPVPEGRDYEQFSLWGIYGAPNGNPWDGHHWGYTPLSLTQMVAEAGFDLRKVTIGPGHYHEPERDFILEAVK